jgi:hypothetical protein
VGASRARAARVPASRRAERQPQVCALYLLRSEQRLHSRTEALIELMRQRVQLVRARDTRTRWRAMSETYTARQPRTLPMHAKDVRYLCGGPEMS